MSPQCAQLLAALRQQPLTSLEILQKLGIYRAGARVFDLRADGHRIATDMVAVPTRERGTAHVARYALLPESTNGDLWEATTEARAA
jgi:hypothetical protein